MIFLFRMIMLGILSFVWLIAGTFVCIIRPRNRNNLYFITQMLSKVIWLMGVKVIYRIDVKELRKLMPAVFVGNHQSNWDIVTMSKIPQPGLVCVGKKTLLWAPIFGILFFLSGNIAVDRKSSKTRAGAEFMKVAEKIKNGLSIWMFPEGHRSKGAGMLPFKNGATHTAYLAGVPIIPFVTSSYIQQIKLNRWNNGEIIVEMLPPRSLKDVDKKDLKKFTRQLRSDMLARLKEIDKQVKRPEGTPDPIYPSDDVSDSSQKTENPQEN